MFEIVIRPGVNVNVSAADAVGGDPTATDAAFMPVVTERGPTDVPAEITSIDSHRRLLGDRAGGVLAYDAVWALLTLGVSRVVTPRVVGPAATAATVDLNDATPAAAIRVSAASEGEWGNNLTVEVQVGSDAALRTYIVAENTIEVVRFVDLASVADAVAAMADSTWVRGTDLGGAQPAVVAATPLAGGAADEANITLTEVDAALATAAGDYGRGQVVAPGWTSSGAAEMLLEHAHDFGRAAFIGAAPVDTFDAAAKSAWVALRDAVKAHSHNGVDVSRYGGMFPQWVDLVPYAGSIGRQVPGPVIAAGLAGRSDQNGDGINIQPISGAGQVPTRVAVGVTPTVGDADRTSLHADRINVFRHTRAAGLQLYGFQSVTEDDRWFQLNFSRYMMGLSARLQLLGDEQIGGPQGRITDETLDLFGATIAAELLGDFEVGELYGDTPEDAYAVDVGPTVNTTTTIAAGEKRARVETTLTRSGDTVAFDVVSRPIA